MHLEIRSNGQCRPLGFRSAFPARCLVWHTDDGRCLGIDAGYGPPAAASWPERLYARLFRVTYGEAPPPLDALLLTHHHLDHAGGVGRHACVGPALPPRRGPFGQLRHATFARTTELKLSVLPAFSHERFGFPAVAWFDLEVLHLPGHTLDHHGVYFPALHLLYVCDAVWWLRWLDEGRVPRWARMLQEDAGAFCGTFARLVDTKRADPALRFRCAHDPSAPRHEIISV
jgi:glyoxylase-like metal-dependent hydrolase (beta-lactamase superfamily II)